MRKESQASAMEIDDPKPKNSDQISPKFSINGSLANPFVSDIIISVVGFFRLDFNLILIFTVLQLLKSAQMQHGLRHGDYTRYRYIFIVIWFNFVFYCCSWCVFVCIVSRN